MLKLSEVLPSFRVGPKFHFKIERQWREIRKEDRLTGMVFEFIKDRMKIKDDWVKLRAVQRRFTKTKNELMPVIEPYLEKGKTYHLRDFRGYVVEEWIRTGAAKLI